MENYMIKRQVDIVEPADCGIEDTCRQILKWIRRHIFCMSGAPTDLKEERYGECKTPKNTDTTRISFLSSASVTAKSVITDKSKASLISSSRKLCDVVQDNKDKIEVKDINTTAE